MYVLRLQTCIVWFLILFSEGLMYMRQNFKLFCCAAISNLIVSICLSCWPNLWCSGVFSADFRSFRKNSAKPDISRKYGSASRIFFKIRLRGLGQSDNTTKRWTQNARFKRVISMLTKPAENRWKNFESNSFVLCHGSCWQAVSTTVTGQKICGNYKEDKSTERTKDQGRKLK